MSCDVEHEDFIGVYDDFLSEETCRNLIDYFEWQKQNNRTWGRGNDESRHGLNKKDEAVTLSYNSHDDNSRTFSFDNLGQLVHEFNDRFWGEAYKHYSSHFGILNELARHSILSFKIQKTLPGEGYHVWHCEAGTAESSKRIGVYSVYLNDVETGGETEFLYQKRRVQPKTGRLVIWPAAWTHPHRGNPPLSGVKYMMTGWIEYV